MPLWITRSGVCFLLAVHSVAFKSEYSGLVQPVLSMFSPSSNCFVLPRKIIISNPGCVFNIEAEDAQVSFQGLWGWRQDARGQSFLSVFRFHEIQVECSSQFGRKWWWGPHYGMASLTLTAVHICLHYGMASLTLTAVTKRWGCCFLSTV